MLMVGLCVHTAVHRVYLLQLLVYSLRYICSTVWHLLIGQRRNIYGRIDLYFFEFHIHTDAPDRFPETDAATY